MGGQSERPRSRHPAGALGLLPNTPCSAISSISRLRRFSEEK